MTGEASYDVSLDYFLTWFTEPHYVYQDGRWVERKGIKKNTYSKNNNIFF
jgi:hypothetical protein